MKWLASLIGQSTIPRADFGLGVGVAAFAGLFLWEANKIPPPFFDPLGSAAVPEGIAAFLAVLAGFVLLRALAALPWQPQAEPKDYRTRPDIAIGLFLAAIGYVGSMEFNLLGFRAATIVFVIVASALLSRFQPRLMAIGALVAFFVGFGGASLFTNVFFIALP